MRESWVDLEGGLEGGLALDIHEVENKGRWHVPHQLVLVGVQLRDWGMLAEEGDVCVQGPLNEVTELVALGFRV